MSYANDDSGSDNLYSYIKELTDIQYLNYDSKNGSKVHIETNAAKMKIKDIYQNAISSSKQTYDAKYTIQQSIKHELNSRFNHAKESIIRIIRSFEDERNALIKKYNDTLSTSGNIHINDDSLIQEYEYVKREMALTNYYNSEVENETYVEYFSVIKERPMYRYCSYNVRSDEWIYSSTNINDSSSKIEYNDPILYALFNCIKPIILYIHKTGQLHEPFSLIICKLAITDTFILLDKLGYTCSKTCEQTIISEYTNMLAKPMEYILNNARIIMLSRQFYIMNLKKFLFEIADDNDIVDVIFTMYTNIYFQKDIV